MSHPAENVYGCYGSNANENPQAIPSVEVRIFNLEHTVEKLRRELDALWIHITKLELKLAK